MTLGFAVLAFLAGIVVGCRGRLISEIPGASSAELGSCLAANETVLFVGAPGTGSSGGVVYAYDRTAGYALIDTVAPSTGTWTSYAFGNDCTMAGDTLVVSDWQEQTTVGSNAGAVYVYDSTLGLQKRITASDEEQLAYFGTSVALSGDGTRLFACSYFKNYPGPPFTATQVGKCYVHDRDSPSAGQWGEVATLEPSDPHSVVSAYMGWDIAVNSAGTLAFVGAPNQALIFGFTSAGSWTEQFQITSNVGERLGQTVSYYNPDSQLYAGEPQFSDFASDGGIVWLYNDSGTRVGNLTRPGGPASNVEFGDTVHAGSGLVFATEQDYATLLVYSDAGVHLASFAAPDTNADFGKTMLQLDTHLIVGAPASGVSEDGAFYVLELVCPPGTIGDLLVDQGCVDCPAGTYQPDFGADNVALCLSCGAFGTSDQGAAACLLSAWAVLAGVLLFMFVTGGLGYFVAMHRAKVGAERSGFPDYIKPYKIPRFPSGAFDAKPIPRSPLIAAEECSVDVVILVVTQSELIGALDGRNLQNPRKVVHDRATYFVGEYGASRVAIIQAQGQGSLNAYKVASRAIELWKPKLLVNVGIAFGMKPHIHKLGDVLVANKIIDYGRPHRSEKAEEDGGRGTVSPDSVLVSPGALALFAHGRNDWSVLRPGSHEQVSVHIGPLLTGPKLLDNSRAKNELHKEYPKALGGEMEGSGVADAALEHQVQFIVVKAVVDYADGYKESEWQPWAAYVAANCVKAALSIPGPFSSTE